jgi:hypothetical protein
MSSAATTNITRDNETNDSYVIKNDDEWNALKNLHLYGSQEIKGRRSEYEKSGGQTYIQMIMAGYNPDVSEERYEQLPYQIDDIAGFIENNSWGTFKQYYSWFTGVKMHRNDNMELTDNEDEHVLPVGFMLLFGGGLAKQIIHDAMIEETPIHNMSKEEIENWLTTDAGKTHMKRLEKIENTGKDDSLLNSILSNRKGIVGPALDLLGCMYNSNPQNISNFLLNQLKLNYYGYFLSEAKANRVKSDYVFVKLVKNSKTDEVYFSPVNSAIEEFVNEIFCFFKSYNLENVKKLESMVNGRKSNLKSEPVNKEGEEIVYSTNMFTRKWFPTSSGSIVLHDKSNVETATNNMKYIIKKLVNYLNIDLRNRIFFNIIMSTLYLKKTQHKTLNVGRKVYGAISKAVNRITHINKSPNRKNTHPDYAESPSKIPQPTEVVTSYEPKPNQAHINFVNAYLEDNNNLDIRKRLLDHIKAIDGDKDLKERLLFFMEPYIENSTGDESAKKKQKTGGRKRGKNKIKRTKKKRIRIRKHKTIRRKSK